MITKQSLPSSRQVQLATRLTAWRVAQVQLRPAQGGTEYYCTGILLYWNITVLEYYCTRILQGKLNWISHHHTGEDLRELSQCGSWLPRPYWLLKHKQNNKQNRICCELSKAKLTSKWFFAQTMWYICWHSGSYFSLEVSLVSWSKQELKSNFTHISHPLYA